MEKIVKLQLSIKFRIVLYLSLLFLISNCRIIAQTYDVAKNDLEKYEQIYSSLDSSIYLYKTLIVDKYFNGIIKFLAIGASQMIDGKKQSFFLDSAKTYYKNGLTKKIQMRSATGDPTYCKCYDNEGRITKYCKHIIDDPDTDLVETNYCFLYSDEVLIEEGPYVSRNKKLIKHGLHIFYNEKSEPRKVMYINGREQNSE